MSKNQLTKKGQFFDYSTLIIVLVLIAFGLVMIYSTSYYSAVSKNLSPSYYLKKQLLSTCLGLVCMFIATVTDYRIWYKFTPYIYAFSLFSILLVLTPLGREINNAKRWINVAGMSFQPAELVKLALIVTLAAFACYSGKYIKKAKNNIVFVLLGLIPALMIYVITKNLSTAIIILGITYIMLIISNPRPGWIYVFSIIAVILIAVFLVIFFNTVEDGTTSRFRFNRLLAWKNPNKYYHETGYQTLQAMYAIGSGGFFGKGLGQSIQKLGFIPEAQNDMIFSIVCEELGLFGGICLIMLFVILIYRFMVIANNSPDLYGSLIVVGVMAQISIQVILNIAVVTNTIPNTGISLPFISYGGTSVLFLMTEIGLVLSVSRQIRVPVMMGHGRNREERQ